MTGAVTGLSMEAPTVQTLAIQYLAHVQALAYNTLQIIRRLQSEAGYEFQDVVLCGGLAAHNPLFVQIHREVLPMPVLVVQPEVNAMTLGAAMHAAVATGVHDSFPEAAQAMASNVLLPPPASTEPRCEAMDRYHKAKYECYESMAELQLRLRAIMPAAGK